MSYADIVYPERLDEIDVQLDAIHESCPDVNGSCWCCCIDCTEREDLQVLQDEYWAIVTETQTAYLANGGTLP